MKKLSKSEHLLLQQMGAKFKELRIKSGYSSYENFAYDHNLNRMQYWRLEKGLSNMSMSTLLKLLNVHGLSLSAFFTQLKK